MMTTRARHARCTARGVRGSVYWLVFAAVLSTVVVPLPEEAALLGAGYASRIGRASLAGVLAAAWVAVLIGDVATFLVGRALLARVLRTRVGARVFPPARRKWAEQLVHAHGVRAILLARFLVGLRGFVYLALGEARYPVRRFVALDGAVGVVEIGLLVGAGFFFGELRARVGREIDVVAAAVIALAMIAPFAVGRLRRLRG